MKATVLGESSCFLCVLFDISKFHDCLQTYYHVISGLFHLNLIKLYREIPKLPEISHILYKLSGKGKY
jgi:hypothetical protein